MQDVRFFSAITKQYSEGNLTRIEMEKTLFYPDSEGGQLGDRGKIGNANVLKVYRDDSGVVVHEVSEPVSEASGQVECLIDGLRRLDIAQQHTAQHLLSADIFNLYGYQTVGFAMGEAYSTIDIDGGQWDWERSENTERMMLEQIMARVEVEILDIPKSDIHLYPLRKKMNEKIEHLDTFRIVKIGNIDYSLCGGFHVEHLAQIGGVKIIKYEKVKSDWTRLYFVSGFRALADYQKKTRLLHETTLSLSTSVDELNYRIHNILEEHQEAKKINRKLSENLASALYNSFRSQKAEEGVKTVVEIMPSEEIAKGLSGKLMSEENTIAFLLYERPKGSGYILSSTQESWNAKSIFQKVKEFLEIKGGGTEKMVQGTVEGNISAIKEKCESIIKSYFSSGGLL